MEGIFDLDRVRTTRGCDGAHPGAPPDLGAVFARFARLVKMKLRSHDLSRYGIDEDDVEQEIRIRLWGALERDPVRELPSAYVQKIVFSAVVDAVRRERVRRRELVGDLDPLDADLPDATRQPDALLAERQWAEHLHDCLANLPVRRRRPVQLFLLGYTFQEAADANGVTLDAVSKLIRRGLADLRLLLNDGRR